MARANREYQIRPMVCDWALDIPMGDTTFVLHFNSRNNAELVKAVLEWEDSHPNEAIPYQPTITPPNEPLTRAERHKYTRAELESITQETAIYIEGAGIAQLQWGGLEIAEGCRDGYLYCKHIKPFSLELYGQYWTAWDGPPEGETNG